MLVWVGLVVGVDVVVRMVGMVGWRRKEEVVERLGARAIGVIGRLGDWFLSVPSNGALKTKLGKYCCVLECLKPLGFRPMATQAPIRPCGEPPQLNPTTTTATPATQQQKPPTLHHSKQHDHPTAQLLEHPTAQALQLSLRSCWQQRVQTRLLFDVNIAERRF